MQWIKKVVGRVILSMFVVGLVLLMAATVVEDGPLTLEAAGLAVLSLAGIAVVIGLFILALLLAGGDI